MPHAHIPALLQSLTCVVFRTFFELSISSQCEALGRELPLWLSVHMGAVQQQMLLTLETVTFSSDAAGEKLPTTVLGVVNRSSAESQFEIHIHVVTLLLYIIFKLKHNFI